MRYRISHKTTYRYGAPVTLSQQVVHLMPRETPNQACERFWMNVEPAATANEPAMDYFGNPVRFLSLSKDHSVLSVLAVSEVRVEVPEPRDPEATMPWDRVSGHVSAGADEATRDAVQYCFDSPLTGWSRDLPAYALESFPAGRPILAGAMDLTWRINHEFRYDPTVTDVTTPVDEAFDLRAGVCQDLAHVQIACLRALGLPARYVSGYLLTHPPEGQQKLIGADASHAWVSVFCPPVGWVDLDPTNNIVVAAEHITSAWGRDYADVSPISGVITGGGAHTVEVEVDVSQL